MMRMRRNSKVKEQIDERFKGDHTLTTSCQASNNTCDVEAMRCLDISAT
jgi:hypothetical protein